VLDELLFEGGFTKGTLIIGCLWAKAVWDRGVDLSKSTVEMIKGTPDALSAAKSAADQDGVLDGYAALETMAGEIKTSLQRYDAVTLALMADATFWSMLMSFIRDLYNSLSAEDKAKLFGTASFDLASCFIGAAALTKLSANACARSATIAASNSGTCITTRATTS
jgi:hypothetical protein